MQTVDTLEEIKSRFTNPEYDNSRDKFNSKIFYLFIKNEKMETMKDGCLRFTSFANIGRYFFDFNMDTSQWIQLDTEQDASYFGNWVIPALLTTVSYVEGDIYVNVAPDEEKFLQLVKDSITWQKDNDYFIGLDPGLNPSEIVKDFMDKINDLL